MKDKFRDDIADRFLRETRTFINELIEGTNTYRQISSLSEQFPHDYHDRFLVELIQNANDASTGGEVRIVLDEINNDTPILYVANQGKPFILKNFEALCSLGLSDKDPMEAIGNKGLGFRSVLQICFEPRIYSAADGYDREGFNGYCFQLTPSARDVVAELITKIQPNGSDASNTSQVAKKYLGVDKPLLSEASRVDRLRSCIEKGERVVSGEVEFLSPYSFPLPLLDRHADIDIFNREGFVTVIELVLKKTEDLEAVKRAISNIVSEYLLFTPRLTKLVVEHRTRLDEENLSLVLDKKPIEEGHRFYPPAPITAVEIVRNPGNVRLNDPPHHENSGTSPESTNIERRVWWMHTGDITGEDLKLALQKLPKKWHEVTKAIVTIGLELSPQEPQAGLFSIYLPTTQETGSPVSVNGPFYGNLPRTEIDFRIDYNYLLLEEAVVLLIDMLNYIRQPRSLENGTIMLDILDCRDPSSMMIQLLDQKLRDLGTPLSDLKVVYLEPPESVNQPEDTLAPISSIRILPESTRPRQFFTPSTLAQVGGCFPASIIAQSRHKVLGRLAERAGNSLMPKDTEITDWVKKIAISLLKRSATLNDWNTFYREISDLNEKIYFQDALRNCRFLLTEDRRLVASDGDGPRIFAYPVRTGTPTEDTGEEEHLDSSKTRVTVPSRIRSKIAFLHSGISIIEDGPSRMYNSVGQFLRGNPPMVRNYETRVIVNDVIIPLVLKASVRKSVSNETLAQALSWAYQLYLSVSTDTTFSGVQWNRLYVPTVSGWKPTNETYFSAGWTGTLGCLVEKAFPQNHQVFDRFLVSPESFVKMVLGKSSNFSMDDLHGWKVFLRDQCDVLETPMIRQSVFRRTKPDQEQEHLRMTGQGRSYETSQLGNYYNFPDSIWSQYVEYIRNHLTPPITGWEYYYLERLAILNGLVELQVKQAAAYAQLVAHGFSKMQNSLETRVTRRGTNISKSYTTADSSLAFALKHFPWLPYVGEDEAVVKGLSDPDHVWLIPPDILDSPQSRLRYSFVNHLPKDVALSMTDDFRRFIGLRSIKIASAEEGLILLGDLASSWKAKLTPERHQYFIDLWRETLVETARLWEGLTEADQESVLQKSEERGFNGLLVTPAGRRFPEWRDMDSEKGPVTLAYLPDDVQIQSSVGEWIDIVEMRGEPITSQVHMLKNLFGSCIACISDLEFVPESSYFTDLQEHVDSAPYLTSRYPWLEAFTLTIFGLGRRLEMNISGDPFRRVARDFRRLKYLEVPGLQLRIKDLEAKKHFCPQHIIIGIKTKYCY
ncbi:sacsin N-terminal ATP-binding-like domain-containing protein [Chloroflexota bacterium]